MGERNFQEKSYILLLFVKWTLLYRLCRLTCRFSLRDELSREIAADIDVDCDRTEAKGRMRKVLLKSRAFSYFFDIILTIRQRADYGVRKCDLFF